MLEITGHTKTIYAHIPNPNFQKNPNEIFRYFLEDMDNVDCPTFNLLLRVLIKCNFLPETMAMTEL